MIKKICVGGDNCIDIEIDDTDIYLYNNGTMHSISKQKDHKVDGPSSEWNDTGSDLWLIDGKRERISGLPTYRSSFRK